MGNDNHVHADRNPTARTKHVMRALNSLVLLALRLACAFEVADDCGSAEGTNDVGSLIEVCDDMIHISNVAPEKAAAMQTQKHKVERERERKARSTQ